MRRFDGIRLSTLAALFLLATAPCRAASNPDIAIRASADRTIVRIGESITYRVTVEYDSTLALAAASPEAILADFEIRGRRSEQGEPVGGRRSVTEEMILACWAPGNHEIGARPYVLVSAEGRTDTLMTAAIPIEVVSTLPDDAQDILDIKGPAEIPKKIPVWWIVGISGAVIGAGVILFWWIRRRRRRPVTLKMPPPRPAHEVAYETLEELGRQNLPGSGQMKAYYIALSEIVRRYLGARFDIPAMDRTTAELLFLLRQVECGRESVGGIREILDASDNAKFARWEGTLADAEKSMEGAYRVVDETKRTPIDGPATAAASAGGRG